MPVEVSGIKLNRVHKIVTLEQGAFVYHHIPGLEGNVVQDLGRDSVRLQIEGIFYGPEARDGLEGLREVYKAREPVDFLAEVIGQAYFGQVILERFEVSQLAGEPDQFSYSLVVTEYVKPPEPATAAAASVEQAIKLDADTFMEMATLPDMLSLGAVPELTNPVVPLTGALDPITVAVEALQSATEALTRLFEQDGDGGTPPDIPPEWGAHPPTPLDWGPSPDGRDGQPPDILLGRDGQPILGLNGQPLGADGTLRDRDGQPILGPHGELLGPDGRPLLGPNGELLGLDSQPLRGPNGTLLGAQGKLLRPDGVPMLGPNGALLDADGNSLLGPDGELLGPDGQALLDADGQPLGPDGQPIDTARLTIALLDEASEPVPGAAYALTLGAEEIERGWLNMQGQVQVKGLKTATDYTLTLADFDGLEAVTVRIGQVVIALTDEDGTPVARVWYVLSLADGSTREGTLDATGQAVLAGLEPGLTYRLSFPDYALTAWSLAEEMRPPMVQTGWMVITLVEEAGTPVPGAVYVLSLADGSTREGTLDATGQAVLTDLAPGLTYRLSFPAYNLTAWGRVEELPRGALRPGWVAITLVDETGESVPGVRYVLTLADGSTQEGWLDATGQALLAGLEPGLAHRLSFPEVAPAAWRNADEVQEPVVQPGWVTITVVDEADAPVSGARYVLSLADGSTHEGRLDAHGQAALTGLNPGVVYRLTLPHYDRMTWESVEANQAAAARPGWATVALLADAAGTPVAGVVYVLTLADGSTRTGALNADGQTVLADLEPGVVYHLSFPTYDCTAWEGIEDTQAAAPPGWVALAMGDEAGAPMAGAVYVLTLSDGSTCEGILDAAGEVMLTELEVGVAYHLSFPGYDRTAWDSAQEGQVPTTRPGWVALALVDEVGTPVAGVVYVLTLADRSTRTGTLDATGQVVLADLEPELAYGLSFPQLAATAWGRDDGQTAETQPGRIAMTLVDEAEVPIAGAAYVLTLADGSTQAGCLDATGQAVIMALEPGVTYHLSFPAYDVTAWGRVEEVRAAAAQAGWAGLALVDEAGTPVAGARYVLTLADGSTREGTLDADGQAMLTTFAVGDVYRLTFPEYDSPAWSQGEGVPALVTQPGRLLIALRNETGEPVAGAVYVLSLPDGSTRKGTLDAAGQADLADLEPGVAYHLSFPAYDITAWGRVEDIQTAVRPGWVALSLVDEAGTPLTGVSYVLTLIDGSTYAGTLDETGQAVITGLAPGLAYDLSFPEYARTAWGRVEALQAPTTQPSWVRLALVDEADVPVAGAVYVLTLADASTRVGVLDADGQAVVADLESRASYRLSFPAYDVTAWGRVEESQAVAPPGWVALAMRDEAGAPMAGAVYVLTLADGSTCEGTLDAAGRVVLTGLEPGRAYSLTFPAYDRTIWGFVDVGRTAEARSGWVAMTLVDEAGEPMGGAAYVLTLEDGNTRAGALDAAGHALLEDLEPGQVYRLSFPEYDGADWDLARG